MAGWPYSDEQLRAMYAGGRGNETARRFARAWAKVFASGAFPRRWVTLEVAGRRTGRPMRVPLGMAEVDGRWHLVSMLGECGWVRNVRAAEGRATLLRGRRTRCVLVEVPVEARGPILARYVAKVPGGRPHIPVAPGSPLAAFEAIAAEYPVFEALQASSGAPKPYVPTRSWAPAAIAGLVGVAVVVNRRGRRRLPG